MLELFLGPAFVQNVPSVASQVDKLASLVGLQLNPHSLVTVPCDFFLLSLLALCFNGFLGMSLPMSCFVVLSSMRSLRSKLEALHPELVCLPL